MGASPAATVAELRSTLDTIAADADLEPAERIARLRSLRTDLGFLVGCADRYLGDNELEREGGATQRYKTRQLARENASIREELIRRGKANADECDAMGLWSHDDLDRMEADGTLGEALEEAVAGGAFGLGALHGSTFNDKVKRDHGKFSTMNVAGAAKPVQRGAKRGAKRAKAVVPRTAPLPATKPQTPETAPQRIGLQPSGQRSKAMAPDDVAAMLAEVEKFRLNDWPTKGTAAESTLGNAKDTQDKWSSPGPPATPGTKKSRGSGRVYKRARKADHDRILGHFLGSAIGDVLGQDHEITKKLKAGQPLTPEDEAAVKDAASARRGGAPAKALFMAGGGGAGKSSALRQSPELKPQAAVEINPDDIKEMLPEYQAMVAAGDKYAATGAHEESSDLARTLEDAAQRMSLNLLIDGTGDSKRGKFVAGIQQAKDAGYDTSAIYVTLPTDVAVVRATKRAMKSGRWVPEPVLREAHAHVSANFDDVAKLPYLRDLQVYDNRDKPTLIYRGGRGQDGEVIDQGLYDEFLNKRHELNG